MRCLSYICGNGFDLPHCFPLESPNAALLSHQAHKKAKIGPETMVSSLSVQRFTFNRSSAVRTNIVHATLKLQGLEFCSIQFLGRTHYITCNHYWRARCFCDIRYLWRSPCKCAFAMSPHCWQISVHALGRPADERPTFRYLKYAGIRCSPHPRPLLAKTCETGGMTFQSLHCVSLGLSDTAFMPAITRETFPIHCSKHYSLLDGKAYPGLGISWNLGTVI